MGNNIFAETPTTISADGTVITFLSNCDLIKGGNLDLNYELFLWVQGKTPTPFIQVTTTTINGGTGAVVVQNNPAMTVVNGVARIAFMSNADAIKDLTPCTRFDGKPCNNLDGNTEIFRADVDLAKSTVAFTQATNTNQTGTSCVNCPRGTTTTDANGWPVINLDGSAIAFHSCCPSKELSPCSPVLSKTCTDPLGIDVFQWRDKAATPYTQVTNTDKGTELFAISMTTVAGASWLAFYGDGNPVNKNPDFNREIFRWTEGAAAPVQQITQTTTCSNRLPAINIAGDLLSFTSTCPTGAGGLGPCARYDGAPCDNADGNEELFLWVEKSGTPFTQITETVGKPGSPDNFRSSIAIDLAKRVNIAFWSNQNSPTPVKGDCPSCNNPNGNHQLFAWVQGAAPPFSQLTPAQPNCNPLNPTCISLNSNDGSIVAFSYNCDPVKLNGDGNYEIFIDPPHGRR